MNYIIVILGMLLISDAFATESWEKLSQGAEYRLNQSIKIQEHKIPFELKEGSKLVLIESQNLNMIKVKLQKYKILNCKKPNLKSELELVPIKRAGSEKVSVGVNLSPGCILEVFVENKDVSANSFFI